MNDPVFGADESRAFNPQNEIYYAMSQDAEFELRELFQSMAYIGDLAEGQPGDQLADLGPDAFGCILRTFARHGQRLLIEQRAIRARGQGGMQ
jgi:hypothetical protein